MPTQQSPAPRIDAVVDLDAFFAQVVSDASRASGLEASHASLQYLSGLLSTFVRPAAVHNETFGRPLALLLAEALGLVGVQRFERLRLLGDSVLYQSGFFGEHLDHRGLERDYVNGVGAIAYDHAAAMLRRNGSGGAPDLFDELAHRFDRYVGLLELVSDSLSAQSAHEPKTLVELYERWLRTGSPVLRSALHRHGLVPVVGDDTLH